MSAPSYIALQGQTPIQINHAYYPIVSAFDRTKTTPISVKVSATHVGKVKGVPTVNGSMTFMVSTTGLADIMDLEDFTISYSWSGTRYMIMHCDWSDDSRNVNPQAGDNGMTVRFTGTAEIP